MADDKLKQELLYMASLTSKYDFSKMEVVEGILRLENERRILDSVFGRRFKARIFDIAAGVDIDNKCVLCGQDAENHVICNHCMETILGSDYAKSKIKPEKKHFKLPNLKAIIGKVKLPEIKKPFVKKEKREKQEEIQSEAKRISTKQVGLYLLAANLALLMFFQLWVLYSFLSIPDINPTVEAKVSSSEPVEVADEEAAKEQLKLDFPEEEGYTITYVRQDVDFVGRFLLERGACCTEVEEQLSDEERYDYFFQEPVFIFYISNIEEYSARVGIAEVNEAGAILVMGSFNDGRRTDSFYKYR